MSTKVKQEIIEEQERGVQVLELAKQYDHSTFIFLFYIYISYVSGKYLCAFLTKNFFHNFGWFGNVCFYRVGTK